VLKKGERNISVVIPCYNQASFLPDAIDSVLKQTYLPSEVIVVDDGSTQDIKQIVDAYPYIRYLRQSNQGLSAARNTGLRQVKGEYLVFLDADDRLLPEAFETALRYFEAHPDCVFVSGRVREIATDGSLLPTPDHPLIELEHYYILLKYCYICTAGAVMFKRDIFDAVGPYNSGLMATGDWDLYLRITKKYAVHNYDDLIAEYRRHGEQMTSDAALMLRECLNVLRSQRRFVKGNQRYEKALDGGIALIQDFYGAPLVQQIRTYISENQWKEALRGFLTLLIYWPAGLRRLFLPR
jgi:glycosyltransferase involved in cell wall biosynthesis